MNQNKTFPQKKSIICKVVSNKMDKAVTVQWEVRKKHPLYKKYITRHRKMKARDEKNTASVGDLVRIVETRPLSKTISWKVVEIVEKAHEE